MQHSHDTMKRTGRKGSTPGRRKESTQKRRAREMQQNTPQRTGSGSRGWGPPPRCCRPPGWAHPPWPPWPLRALRPPPPAWPAHQGRSEREQRARRSGVCSAEQLAMRMCTLEDTPPHCASQPAGSAGARLLGRCQRECGHPAHRLHTRLPARPQPSAPSSPPAPWPSAAASGAS